MRVGFTGTREKLSDAQIAWLYTTLEDRHRDGTITATHHGACVGADETVHLACLDVEIPVTVWPPTNLKLTAAVCLVPHPLVRIMPRMPYLNRDREIVNNTTGLIALPRQDRQPPPNEWGGTWYTVNFAQRMGRPIVICYPSGAVEQRRPDQPGYDKIRFD